MKIAFIGLGNMGGGMAANLVRAGHTVRAFDLSADAAARAGANGCEICTAASLAVDGVDAVVSMLPDGRIVRQVYADDVFGKAPTSAVLIDCSTIDVTSAREVASQAAAQGYVMLDAPVSGGIAAADAGTLTFMVGGSADGFARAEPVLRAMGKVVIHAGDAGAGQAAKICNNMILGVTMLATCEAFAMAGKLGLDLATFYEIASKASGQSWSMTSYCPVPGVGPVSPADRNYEGGFAAALMLKDLRLAQEAAGAAGAKAPMGDLARKLYEDFARDHGAADFSGIIRTL